MFPVQNSTAKCKDNKYLIKTSKKQNHSSDIEWHSYIR